ncbi:MAG: hypothetical protein FJZ86_10470 [Chloroflexi bacterium]|nr:hypothetical protein [Chloroflexota bacterium]
MNQVHTHQNGGRAAMTTLNGHYRKLIRDADGLTRRDPFINPPSVDLICRSRRSFSSGLCAEARLLRKQLQVTVILKMTVT